MTGVFYERENIDTISELITRSKIKFRDYPSVKYKLKNEIIIKSYNELDADVLGFGQMLKHHNLLGKHIAILGTTSYFWIVSYLGTMVSGSVAVPLDKELSGEEVLELMNHSETACLVFDEDYKDIVDEIAKKKPNLLYINMQEMRLEEESRCEPSKPFPSQLAAILFTSGTTGGRKGVMLSHQNLAHGALSGCASIIVGTQNSVLSILPIHHAYESTLGIMSMIYFGTTICLNDSLKHLMQNFKLFQPTTLLVVPLILETMYRKIWEEARKQGKERKLKLGLKMSNFLLRMGIDIRRKIFADVLAAFGGKLNLVMCGGAYMNPKLIKQFYAIGIQVLQGYGITECSPLVAANTELYQVAGAVGNIVPYCRVKIEDGEVMVQGSIVFSGYWNDVAATEQAFTNGWFHTGDMGRFEKDTLYLTGRKKNLIILSNGENVSAEEMENKLLENPLVQEVVVYGKDDKIYAEIFPDNDEAQQRNIIDLNVSLKEEIAAFNKNMPAYKQISQVKIRDKEFEKTTTKKIQRFKITKENEDV